MERSPGAQPDLRSAINVLWRRKWLFLAVFVSIPVAVYVISSLVPKTYTTYSLIATHTSSTEVPGLSSGTLESVGSEALLVETTTLTKAAAEEMGLPESQAGSLSGSIRADPVTTSTGAETDLIQLTAHAGSASRAAAIANAYAAAVDKVRTDESLKQIDRAKRRLQAQARDATDQATQDEIARQLQVVRSARTAAEDSTELVQAARVPSSPTSPNPKRNTGLAIVVSFLLALGAVVIRERLDRTLRDSNDLEPLLGTPLLSVIPRAAFPGARPSAGPVREAFRTLASSLVYFNIDRPLSTVMISSPTKGDGKTTVSVHLAAALAKDGQDVVLVDADLRHPQVAARLGIEPLFGLSEVITNQGELSDALVEVDVGDGRLRVLAAGGRAPNPARLLSSRSMRALLLRLSQEVDIVVVDTPPILNVSDAVPLLESVSGTVLVAKVGATTRDSLQRIHQVIETARGTLLGAVATGSGGAGFYGYGGEYYEYGGEPDTTADASIDLSDAATTNGDNGRAEGITAGPPANPAGSSQPQERDPGA